MLERADDKVGYEAGAYTAARDLAGLKGVEAMALRLRLFDGKLETYRGVYLRDWFYSGMQKYEGIEEAALLVEAAASKRSSELLRVLALRALALGTSPAPAHELLDKDFLRAPPAVRHEWQLALGTLHAQGRLDFAKLRAKDPARLVRELLLEAAPDLSGLLLGPNLAREDLLAAVAAASDCREPGTLAELLRALTDRGDAGGSVLLPLIELGLSSPECGPRTAALDAAVRGQIWEAAPALIRALEAEAAGANGRFLRELGDTLAQLTGQRLGWSPATWRRWWDGAGAEWLARARAGEIQPAAGGPASGEERTEAVVFGIPVDSKRLIILVDGSGSMLADKLGERTCAEAAAAELESFLGQLTEDARFELIVIGDEPHPAFGRLSPATRQARAKAVEFLRSFDFGGTSALYDVLVHAQRLPEADTIVLISDGGGSSGSHQFAGHMLEGLRREHRRSGVRIHGICVGKDAPKVRFMTDLAKMTGGIMAQPDG